MLYKIYFYDIKLQDTYPITVWQNDICELAEWLNDYLSRWKMECVSGVVVNTSHSEISPIKFLPTEIESQRFVTNLEQRLLDYYKYYHQEVGVLN